MPRYTTRISKTRTTSLALLSCCLFALAGCGGKKEPAETKSSSKSKPAGRVTSESDNGNSKNSAKAVTNKPKGDETKPSPSTILWAKVKLARFANVARQVGVDHQFYNDQVAGRFLLVESMGGAAAWFDFDRDGWQDLYLTNGNTVPQVSQDYQNQLLRNIGGTFSNTTTESNSGNTGYGFGVAIGDFDLDGFDDVYITNYGMNSLLRNNGDGTFSSVKAGIEDKRWGAGCVWFDANSDGLPDLYVANYLDVSVATSEVCQYHGKPGYCGPQHYDAQSDRVFVSNGDGTFRDATATLGFDIKPAYSLGVACLDLDGNLQPELVVATDMTPNSLFAQGTAGRWADQAGAAGVDTSSTGELEAGMGIACADYDCDARPDFLLTHYYEKKNTLYRNLGDMIFSDESARSRIQRHSLEFLGFGTNAIDVNRDAAPDLFIANGHVLGPNHDPSEMTAQILLNNGRGRFDDVSASSGSYFFKRQLGRGSADADFDNDGDRDITVVHLDQPVALLQDRGKNPHWIGLIIESPSRNGLAGGRIEVSCGGWNRTIPLVSGGSYLSVNDARILTAVPSDGTVDVRCHLPGGVVFEGKAPRNKYVRLGPRGIQQQPW